MVRPSNPRLMARVLDAVTNLGDTRGSSAREVLSFIRQSNVSPKNLTLQVYNTNIHIITRLYIVIRNYDLNCSFLPIYALINKDKISGNLDMYISL